MSIRGSVENVSDQLDPPHRLLQNVEYVQTQQSIHLFVGGFVEVQATLVFRIKVKEAMQRRSRNGRAFNLDVRSGYASWGTGPNIFLLENAMQVHSVQ